MDIYAKKGTKVKYTGDGGYDSHKEHANKYLKVGETYTVLNTNVSGWHTDVFLQEVPNQCFNSVHFEELAKQCAIHVVSNCKHKNEQMKQGDGFVYVTCKDCGTDL